MYYFPIGGAEGNRLALRLLSVLCSFAVNPIQKRKQNVLDLYWIYRINCTTLIALPKFAPLNLHLNATYLTKSNNMTKEDTIKIDGVVEELLPNMTFRVTLQNGMKVFAHLCGKMRMRNIRVMVGDTVTVEMSPYDLTKARIIFRQR